MQAAYGRTVKTITQDNVTTYAIRYPLPLKRWYWFIPQGELPTDLSALDDGALFVRYEPAVEPHSDRQVADVQPSKTLITTLADDATLLQQLKQKCRYNLRIAQKKGVTIHTDTDLETFYATLERTSNRQEIRLHPKRYYQTMVETLQRHNMVKLYRAEYEGHVVAVAMVVYHQGVATYLHGGSDYEYRSVMAPYLLHWQAMQDARSGGCQYYDWYGIGDQWPGVTRFKLGFGGTAVQRPGTFEHVLRPLWYTGYRLSKKLWIS